MTNVTINVTDSVGHAIALGAASPPVAGTSEVTIDGGFEQMTFSNPTTSLSLTGTGHADTITLNHARRRLQRTEHQYHRRLGGRSRYRGNPAASTTTVATNVATLTSPFFLYVGSTSATFNTGTGTLANILQGNIQFNDLQPAATPRCKWTIPSDSSAKTIGVTSSQIAFSGGIGTIGYSGTQTNSVQVAGRHRGQYVQREQHLGHATTTLFGGFNTAANTNAYNVTVPGLAGTTILDGEGIASTYNLNFAGGSLCGAAHSGIVGHTNAQFVGTSSHRDTVFLNDDGRWRPHGGLQLSGGLDGQQYSIYGSGRRCRPFRPPTSNR